MSTLNLNSQYQRPVFGYRHSVFEMGRVRTIGGDKGKTVFAGFDPPVAGRNHWLNGNDHALGKFWAFPRIAVIGHWGFFVEFPANAMTNKVADDSKTMTFNKFLNGMADSANMIANPSLIDPNF